MNHVFIVTDDLDLAAAHAFVDEPTARRYQQLSGLPCLVDVPLHHALPPTLALRRLLAYLGAPPDDPTFVSVDETVDVLAHDYQHHPPVTSWTYRLAPPMDHVVCVFAEGLDPGQVEDAFAHLIAEQTTKPI